MNGTAHALVYTAPGAAEIQSVSIDTGGSDSVLIETRFSALSRGTERLVFAGRVPEAEWTRMRAPLQVGDFPFPVRYGYAAVGRVIEGPAALLGRDVFSLAPHQSLLRVPAAMAVPVPEGIPPARAVLGANMETALNAVWDAGTLPRRVLIVGAGLLGWLIAALLSRHPGVSVTITDVRPETGALADDFCVTYVPPAGIAPQSMDLAFHTSATEAGLQSALDALDFEGRVVELSWYGDRPVSVSLGANFHANRLSILSSQVGHVATQRRAHVTHRARLARALTHLADDRLDRLITGEVAFRDLPAALPRLLAPDAPGIATRIVYDM